MPVCWGSREPDAKMDKECAAAVARHAGWLSRTPPDFREAVVARSVLRHFPPGQIICCIGDERGGLAGIVQGSVEIHLPAHGGDSTLGITAGVGFWSAASDGPFDESCRPSIRAGRDCWVLGLSHLALKDVATTVPATWRYVGRLLAASQILAFEIVEALRRTDPIQRVAATILILAKAYQHDSEVISISQSEIASIARLSRGTVNTAISDLQAQGLVSRAYGALELTDMDGLVRFVRG